MNRKIHTITESHVALADLATRSFDGLTAFSALPDAPVLPVVDRRPSLVARLRTAVGPRRHRQRLLPRPAVAAGGPSC